MLGLHRTFTEISGGKPFAFDCRDVPAFYRKKHAQNSFTIDVRLPMIIPSDEFGWIDEKFGTQKTVHGAQSDLYGAALNLRLSADAFAQPTKEGAALPKVSSSRF